MGEKVCRNCGERYPADSMITICQKCQQPLSEAAPLAASPAPPPPTEAPEAEKGAEAWEMPPAIPSAMPGPTPPPAVAAPVPPAGPPEIRRVPCPSCGEMLYDTEVVCWRCKARVSEAPPPAAPPPFIPTPPSPPGAEAPPQGYSPTAPPPAYTPPPGAVYPPGVPPQFSRSDADKLATTALWLSGLGCLLTFCSCPVLSIMGLVMGIKARADGSNNGTLPIVLGIVGIVGTIVACIGIALNITHGGAR